MILKEYIVVKSATGSIDLWTKGVYEHYLKGHTIGDGAGAPYTAIITFDAGEELKEGGGMKTKQEILERLQKENPHSIPVFKAMDEYAAQFAGTREEVLRLREALHRISGAAAGAGWAGMDPEKALIKIEQYANNALKPI